MVGNATFYTFKPTPSGKWSYSGRGLVDEHAFSKLFGADERRAYLIALNGGKCPGMSSDGRNHDIVVISDDEAPGWPLMLKTKEVWE